MATSSDVDGIRVTTDGDDGWDITSVTCVASAEVGVADRAVVVKTVVDGAQVVSAVSVGAVVLVCAPPSVLPNIKTAAAEARMADCAVIFETVVDAVHAVCVGGVVLAHVLLAPVYL